MFVRAFLIISADVSTKTYSTKKKNLTQLKNLEESKSIYFTTSCQSGPNIKKKYLSHIKGIFVSVKYV